MYSAEAVVLEGFPSGAISRRSTSIVLYTIKQSGFVGVCALLFLINLLSLTPSGAINRESYCLWGLGTGVIVHYVGWLQTEVCRIIQPRSTGFVGTTIRRHSICRVATVPLAEHRRFVQ